MTNLRTQKQTFDLAKAAGFDNANAEIAAAIAMAETNTIKDGHAYCDFDAVGDESLVTSTWGPSYGAWQVRSLNAQKGTGQYRDALRLPDPAFNASSAHTIWKNAGGSFTPWSTFTSGAYKAYLQTAVYNPPTTLPAGTYMVVGGDSLSKIGSKTGYEWRLIAALNNLVSPYTIYIGNVLILPDWNYTVKSGDYLSKIANEQAEVTWQRIAEYNKLADPNKLVVGQVLKIPRYTSWDGTTLVR